MGMSNLESVGLPYRMPLILHIRFVWIESVLISIQNNLLKKLNLSLKYILMKKKRIQPIKVYCKKQIEVCTTLDKYYIVKQ